MDHVVSIKKYLISSDTLQHYYPAQFTHFRYMEVSVQFTSKFIRHMSNAHAQKIQTNFKGKLKNKTIFCSIIFKLG
jgi:hypothetical protein